MHLRLYKLLLCVILSTKQPTIQISKFTNYDMINIIFKIIILKINKFILLLDYSIKKKNTINVWIRE